MHIYEKEFDFVIQRAKSLERRARMVVAGADCERIAIENPIGIMGTAYRKPDQIIQPYQFGDHARKTTCLWLKNLPLLMPTEIVDPGEILEGGYSVAASAYYAVDENGKILSWNDPRTAKARSKTFPGIAKAMAEQWSAYIGSEAKYDVVQDYIQFKLF